MKRWQESGQDGRKRSPGSSRNETEENTPCKICDFVICDFVIEKPESSPWTPIQAELGWREFGFQIAKSRNREIINFPDFCYISGTSRPLNPEVCPPPLHTRSRLQAPRFGCCRCWFCLTARSGCGAVSSIFLGIVESRLRARSRFPPTSSAL